jgi:arabinofuranosyltransferase
VRTTYRMNADSCASRYQRCHIWGALVLLIIGGILVSIRVGILCDDAFVSFVYVRSLLRGRGLTYNGTVVQGYTNPLWVLLLAGIARLGFEIPLVAAVLTRAVLCALTSAVYWLARRVDLPPSLGVLAAAVVCLSVDVAVYAGSGLETLLFATLLTLCVGLVARPAIRSLHATLAGATAGLLALCRPEGLVAVAAVPLLLAVRRSPSLSFRFALPALLIAAPWFLWAHHYYGDWLPNSFYAKAGALTAPQLRHGLHYVFAPTMSGATVFALVIALATSVRQRSSPGCWLCLAALAWLAYAVLIGGDFMPGLRLVVPVLGIAAVGLLAVCRSISRRALATAFVLLCLLSLARWRDPHTWTRIADWHRFAPPRAEFGRWLHEHVPPGSLLVVSAAGTIPYYSELPTIDALGINDRHIARHGRRDPTLLAGHQMGDGDYILSREPDIICLRLRAPGARIGFVSDRMMAADPRLYMLYRPRVVDIPSGPRFFVVHVRLAPSLTGCRRDSRASPLFPPG